MIFSVWETQRAFHKPMKKDDLDLDLVKICPLDLMDVHKRGIIISLSSKY